MMLLLNKSSNSMRIYVQCLNKDKFLKKHSIRALIDLSDLITVMPIERAIKRTIIDKLEDEREQQAIKNAIELNF